MDSSPIRLDEVLWQQILRQRRHLTLHEQAQQQARGQSWMEVVLRIVRPTTQVPQPLVMERHAEREHAETEAKHA